VEQAYKYLPLRDVVVDIVNRVVNLECALCLESSTAQIPPETMLNADFDGMLVALVDTLVDARNRLEACNRRIGEIKERIA